MENIYLQRDGAIVAIVLNRPDKINALSKATIREIIEALERIGPDETIQAVIIRAEGKHFCAGHDLSEMTERDTVDYRKLFNQCARMMMMLHDLPQPVIAQVHGIATAAGCQLVASCDLAIAEEGATFGTPGVKIGLFCSTPMVPLYRAVGRKRALEMLLTGRMISAAEAAEWGLINKSVPREDLASQTMELAKSIITASPLTIAIGKKAFYQQVDMTEPQAYGMAGETITMNLTTQDAQEGIGAFLEKRKPTWKGR